MKGIVGLLCLLIKLPNGWGITCYSCNNDPHSSGPYDPNCDTDGYDGNVITSNHFHTCYTHIYADGLMYRGKDSDGHEDGTCTHYDTYIICFCTSDKCNNNICEHCGGNPTTDGPITSPRPTTDLPLTTPGLTTSMSELPTDASITTPRLTTEEPLTTQELSTNVPLTSIESTTEEPITDSSTPSKITSDPPTTWEHTTDNQSTTSDVTTEQAITTEKVTTPELTTPQPTTEEIITTEIETTAVRTTVTTKPPVVSLKCYDCQTSEPSYDNYDQDCGADGYDGMTYTCNNCFSCTVQVHENGHVYRGEAGEFEDGSCNFGEGVKTCYCTHDLCNNSLCQHCQSSQEH